MPIFCLVPTFSLGPNVRRPWAVSVVVVYFCKALKKLNRHSNYRAKPNRGPLLKRYDNNFFFCKEEDEKGKTKRGLKETLENMAARKRSKNKGKKYAVRRKYFPCFKTYFEEFVLRKNRYYGFELREPN